MGKWHLGNQPGPDGQGFDWCSTNQAGPLKHFDTTFVRNRKRMETKGYREDVFFDETMAFIEEAGDDPFFCYLCTYSPHTPLAAPEKFIKPFRDAGLNDTHATYLAMVENIDYNLGRLMKFLKDTGRDEDTIVIMVNDNGGPRGWMFTTRTCVPQVLRLGRCFPCLFLLEMARQMETKNYG